MTRNQLAACIAKAVILILPMSAPSSAQADAVVMGIGSTWSWARRDTAEEARAAVSGSCTDCQEFVAIEEGCVAVIGPNDAMTIGTGSSLSQAYNRAIESCRTPGRCAPRVAACTDPARVADRTLFDVSVLGGAAAMRFTLNGLSDRQKQAMRACASDGARRILGSRVDIPGPMQPLPSPVDNYGLFLLSLAGYFDGDFDTRRWENTLFGGYQRLPFVGSFLSLPQEVFFCTVAP